MTIVDRLPNSEDTGGRFSKGFAVRLRIVEQMKISMGRSRRRIFMTPPEFSNTAFHFFSAFIFIFTCLS